MLKSFINITPRHLAQHIGFYSKLSAFCLEPLTPDRCNGSGFFFSMSYHKAFRLGIPYTTKVRIITYPAKYNVLKINGLNVQFSK